MHRTEEVLLKRNEAAARSRVKPFLLLLLLAVVAAIVVIRGIHNRVAAAGAVKQETLRTAIPAVSVIAPRPGTMQNEVVLPGNVQAFTDAPIYARASGYLKRWYVDIGARVKSGQVLAEIDAPELDQQVRQAQATLQQAEAALDQANANYDQGKSNTDLARVTAERWNTLIGKGAVSKQDNDTYQAQYQAQTANLKALEKAVAAARSNIAAAQADLARLTELQGYKLVKASFDGVITARNTDVGALINAGNGGPAQELFHMAAVSPLRVYVSVPEVYSRPGAFSDKAGLTLAEYPGKKFPGRLVRRAGAIDPATRTLLTEVDVDNASGTLMPGAYAQVHLKLVEAAPSLIVPVSAVLFRSEGLRAGVVRGNKADLVPVTLGKDYGTEIEVASGLSANDAVIENPPDSLVSGMEVRVVTPPKAQ